MAKGLSKPSASYEMKWPQRRFLCSVGDESQALFARDIGHGEGCWLYYVRISPDGAVDGGSYRHHGSIDEHTLETLRSPGDEYVRIGDLDRPLRNLTLSQPANFALRPEFLWTVADEISMAMPGRPNDNHRIPEYVSKAQETLDRNGLRAMRRRLSLEALDLLALKEHFSVEDYEVLRQDSRRSESIRRAARQHPFLLYFLDDPDVVDAILRQRAVAEVIALKHVPGFASRHMDLLEGEVMPGGSVVPFLTRLVSLHPDLLPTGRHELWTLYAASATADMIEASLGSSISPALRVDGCTPADLEAAFLLLMDQASPTERIGDQAKLFPQRILKAKEFWLQHTPQTMIRALAADLIDAKARGINGGHVSRGDIVRSDLDRCVEWLAAQYDLPGLMVILARFQYAQHHSQRRSMGGMGLGRALCHDLSDMAVHQWWGRVSGHGGKDDPIEAWTEILGRRPDSDIVTDFDRFTPIPTYDEAPRGRRRSRRAS